MHYIWDVCAKSGCIEETKPHSLTNKMLDFTRTTCIGILEAKAPTHHKKLDPMVQLGCNLYHSTGCTGHHTNPPPFVEPKGFILHKERGSRSIRIKRQPTMRSLTLQYNLAVTSITAWLHRALHEPASIV